MNRRKENQKTNHSFFENSEVIKKNNFILYMTETYIQIFSMCQYTNRRIVKFSNQEIATLETTVIDVFSFQELS